MNILLWSPNYAPEPTGIPPLVTDAAEWLAGRGHAVDVVTAVPNYPERRIHAEYRRTLWRSERRGLVNVHRSWLRAANETTLLDKALYELSISTFALPAALRHARRADVVVCVIPTLLAATYAAALSRLFRKRLVLWVQDLVLAGGRSVVDQRGARLLDALIRIETAVVGSADRVVVCSPGFVERFAARGVDRRRMETILNWADLERISVEPERSGRPRFLYAGNLGHSQGLETLVEAARVAGDGLDVEIVGAGNAASRVLRIASGVPNVVVRPPVPAEAYPRLLASASAHVVVQRRVSAGANLPSKIATSLASGRPVVASIAADTPAATLLRESGAVIVEPESPRALAEAMVELAADRERRRELGSRARRYAEEHLSKDAALTRLESVVCRYGSEAMA